MNQYFWENLIKVMVSCIGKFLQALHIKQQPNAAPSAQAGHRMFYSDWSLAALIGYAQIYI